MVFVVYTATKMVGYNDDDVIVDNDVVYAACVVVDEGCAEEGSQ